MSAWETRELDFSLVGASREQDELPLEERLLEKLVVGDEDEEVDPALVLIPPENPEDSDEDDLGTDEPEEEEDKAIKTLPEYPKNRKWTQPKRIPANDFPKFEPSKLQQDGGKDISNLDPAQLFELFFDNDVYRYCQRETIRYGEDILDDWNVNVGELKVFVAILLLSGYLDIPRYRMYWEPNAETHNTLVSSAMRRNRFEDIKRCFHLADNTDLDNRDKFAKVRPLFDMMNSRFRKYAPLEENLCIDESICPYFGRHSAKQFIRGKPIRFGFKYWALCTKLGYLIAFNPYQGKGDEKDPSLGVGGSVVKKLISVLPKDNHFNIYGDRFFSSVKLAFELKRLGYGYTGTVTVNRTEKCPLKKIEKKPRGTTDYQYDSSTGVLVVSWNDNRPVHILSTVDGIEPMGQARRWSAQDKKKVDVPQPRIVANYNNYMGGVDRMDQNINNYRVSIKSKKWWFSCFTFMLDAALHNAWQLHRRHDGQLDYLGFRRFVTTTYLKKYGEPAVSPGRKSEEPMVKRSRRVSDAMRYDGLNHWPEMTDSKLQCGACDYRTSMKCEKCNVGLHPKCFKEFHIPK